MVNTLYTFRRCPYAIRARLAIVVAGVKLDQVEVDLKAKPDGMLRASPKGTVPVLVCADGCVIDQSMDIMRWALSQHDPEQWLGIALAASVELIEANDTAFKPLLDRYKYAERHPEHSREEHRAFAMDWLSNLEARLTAQPYLLGNSATLADAALMPFVRQFAGVEPAWFAGCNELAQVRRWLNQWLGSDWMQQVMAKR
ncbi:glutathione S-transferase [Chitinibacteraceae bacterium HSL-7]